MSQDEEKKEITEKATDLIHSYVRCIDDDRLEEWPDMFTEDCVYKIIPRENADLGLPLAVMFCDSRAMLRDRIVALRHANIYNIHFDRHLVSNIQMTGKSNGTYDFASHYVVFQTGLDGESHIFNTGKYLDKIAIEDGEAKFKEKIVIMDTYEIRNLLATPI